MTPNLTKKAIRNKVKKFCKAGYDWDVQRMMHIYPKCYITAQAADQCLIIARCWTDSEEQIKDDVKKYPLGFVDYFDSSLRPGDWCIIAYVVVKNRGLSVRVAIPLDYGE